MGERKVINKYFPPDFDPSKIPRTKKSTIDSLQKNFVVRMMLPMSVRCMTCGEYMYKGKKFNSRKEDVEGPEGEYLGIKIFRFYFKCITCSAEFTIKTDPKNMDYAVEGGVKRNFELYRAEAQEKKELDDERAAGEKYDTMTQLENKTNDQKKAMDVLDALEDIRTQNARNASVDVGSLLETRAREDQGEAAAAAKLLDDADDLEASHAFAAARVKRIRDETKTSRLAALGGGSGRSAGSSSAAPPAVASSGGVLVAPSALGRAGGKRAKLPAFTVVQAKPAAAAAAVTPPASVPAPSAAAAPATGGGLLGLGNYDSSGSGSGSGSSSPNNA